MTDLPYGIRTVWITPYIYPGWNRRRRDNGRLQRIQGWRLVLHRILWGFDRLTYIDRADSWTPFPIQKYLPIFFDVTTAA